MKMSASPQSSPSRRSPQWKVHELLCGVFRVTLTARGTRSPVAVHGDARHILELPDLAESCRRGEKAQLLSPSNLDEALFETFMHIMMAGDEWAKVGSLPYLAECYDRAEMAQSRAVETALDTAAVSGDPCVAAAELAMKAAVRYSTTLLLEEDYPSAPKEPTSVLLQLLGGNGNARRFVTHVLGEATSDGRAAELCIPIVAAVNSRALYLVTTIGRPAASIRAQGEDAVLRKYDYPALISLIADLCKHKPIAAALVASSVFLPRASSAGGIVFLPMGVSALQTTTLLGALLSFDAASSAELRSEYFRGDPRQQQAVARRWQQSRKTLCARQRSVQESAHLLVSGMLRASTASRERVCQWLELAVRLLGEPNAVHSHVGHQYRPPGEVFSLNLCAVSLQLCRPFMMPTGLSSAKKKKALAAKQAKIDLRFCIATRDDSASFYPPDETPLCRGAEGVRDDAITRVASAAPSEYHFICRIFWLTSRAMQHGLIASARASLNEDRRFGHHLRGQPSDVQLQQEALFNARRVAQNIARVLPVQISDALHFANLVSTLLMNAFRGDEEVEAPAAAAAASGAPRSTLPLTPNDAALVTVEHLVDDVIALMKHVNTNAAHLLRDVSIEPVATLFLSLLDNPQYVFRVSLRAEIGDVIFMMSRQPGQTAQRGATSTMATAMTAMPIARATLFPSLLALYGDVEETGFYAVSTHRYYIAKMMKWLWQFAAHRDSFQRVSDEEGDRFITFLNGLMNNTNKAINEAIESLPKVRIARQRMGLRADGSAEAKEEWAALSDEEKEREQQELSDMKDAIAGNLRSANESLELLRYTSEGKARVFLVDEVRTHCAVCFHRSDAPLPSYS